MWSDATQESTSGCLSQVSDSVSWSAVLVVVVVYEQSFEVETPVKEHRTDDLFEIDDREDTQC